MKLRDDKIKAHKDQAFVNQKVGKRTCVFWQPIPTFHVARRLYRLCACFSWGVIDMASGGNPTRRSCDMCSWSQKYEVAVTDITFGDGRYSVCAHHRDNPIANPNKIDLGPAPHNGTETSEDAAKSVEGKLNQQCFTVLGVVAAAGSSGVTREEVCQRAGVVNQAACARLNTLEQHGLVIVDGEKRMASTRRTQQVYKLARAAA